MRRESWKTVIEPFKIRSVEPLGFTDRPEREKALSRAGYNLFKVPAEKVLIDLLTDSGTCAMSMEQWAGMMRGDVSYASSRSYYVFERVVKDLTGYPHVIPVHQGRAGERLVFSFLGGPGKVFLSNMFFDTTRANIEATGAEALDLPADKAFFHGDRRAFKGDIDLAKLEQALRLRAGRVPLVLLTVTNNSLGGQPVSLRNIRDASRLCARHKVPLLLDAARFAENAYLIKARERGQAERTVRSIVREMFGYAQGCLMSGKKDALVNMGGFLAFKDKAWAGKAREILILGEGFPTYGGLTGRDLEAMARGIEEVLDEQYLRYRIRSVEYLARGLRRQGIPLIEPPGGHAVYVDAARFLPHIPAERFPGQALACALYLEAGIRAVEIGSLMFGKREGRRFLPARMELLRLALPRRVYTQAHADFIIEVFGSLARKKRAIRGLRLLKAPRFLPHFTARLAPLRS
ncbi:MAG: tryptophanase [Elusimicrobia bacterium]|nr:tryptophanase [Elusimicrobiota bacterium]